jgi:hypothetical protein
VTAIWHATADQVPPYGVIVLARNGERGRPFKAVRILHRKRRWPVWGRQDPRGGVKLLRLEPEYWTGLDGPVEPDRTLPEPPAFAKFAEPRKATPAASVEGRAWWRDPCNLTYSPKGAVTPREAEGRILRALLTASADKAGRPKGLSTNAGWIARQVERVEREAGKRPTYWHARFMPTPRDVSDCATVLEWLAGLWTQDERPYMVLAMRAADPPWLFRQIGEAIGCSEATARRIYKDAIGFVVRRGNGAGA